MFQKKIYLKNNTLITFYLTAIVLSNLVVLNYGQIALIFTAFFLIPFDLVTRDVLHDRWQGNKLFIRMFLLISTGSVLSYIFNTDSFMISIASCISFFIAGTIDFIIYHLLKGHERIIKINVSNMFSSITDSLVFPLIAFQVIDLKLSVYQSVFKILGGFIWGYLFIKLITNKTPQNRF